jgi:hypothetical protein
MGELISILDVPVICSGCKWQGRVVDCEPDDDGTLCCPECGATVSAIDD